MNRIHLIISRLELATVFAEETAANAQRLIQSGAVKQDIPWPMSEHECQRRV
ncbi:MAG: hypothetical protein IT423_23660 [Pirellulaceae bacterium]|nr:hypothetical protein [Pirellulaceae bacterium]